MFLFSESIMEKHGNRNIRRAQTMHGFNDDRCFISFFGTEHFIDEIDTYKSHEMNRARETDRSLESLGNFCIYLHTRSLLYIMR